MIFNRLGPSQTRKIFWVGQIFCQLSSFNFWYKHSEFSQIALCTMQNNIYKKRIRKNISKCKFNNKKVFQARNFFGAVQESNNKNDVITIKNSYARWLVLNMYPPVELKMGITYTCKLHYITCRKITKPGINRPRTD